MKIVVTIKQVPERDAPLAIAPDALWIDEAGIGYSTNEPDAYALEEALRLKESLAPSAACEVIALTAGPERAAFALRDALARGADRAIHIVTSDRATTSDPAARDTLALARTLAAAIRAESPDLVLTGLQSDDLGLGQTGVVLAELLGLPHATLVLHVEKTATGVRIKRELEDGWFQQVEMPLPALATIQSGGNQLRYATLMGIKRARTKELRTIAAATLTAHGANAAAPIALTRISLPDRQKQTQMLTGTPAEIAAQLVERLRTEVRVV
jgi:electron transfer flavoprotein beta subunit